MNVLLLTVLRGLLRKDVWLTNKAALAEDVITNSNVRTLIKYIAEIHDERSGDLAVGDLRLAIEAKYRRPDGRKVELLEIVDLLDSIEDQEFEQVQPRIADFLGRELAAQAAIYIAKKEDTDQFDLRRPYELLERALELAGGMDLDTEDIGTAPPPDAAQERRGVTTVGLGPAMDRHLAGGVGNGEMLIWLAQPGGGKTSLLLNLCVEAAKRGECVLHVTLEISRAKCRQRIDQKLTGLSREERIGRPGIVLAARRSVAGNLHLKDWCGKNVTVDDLRNLVLNLRAKGIPVTLLSVDYLGIMEAARHNRHGVRFDFSEIAKGLRRLANELGVKVVTAWQVNRTGAGKHVVGGIDVAECWDIVMHADIILGLNQNTAESENHVLRVNIIKQRESTARPVEYYYCNLDRMIIREQSGEGNKDEEPGHEMGAGS